VSSPEHVEPAEHARRVRAVFSTLLVAILPWLIAPGKVQPDTKLDLTISPWLYLSRATDAWNSHAGLGELQNQAYGYLFPFGPVMAVAQAVGMPAWAAQRLWWSLLLVVAFTGTYFVAKKVFGIGSDLALVAAALYALAPRVLTVLSQISIEAWPGAVAPWLVLVAWAMVRPRLAGQGSARPVLLRAAAWTALLTLSLGGVNATASAVVLALPFAAILTAPANAHRWRALGFWAGGVLVGSAWWLVPLFVLAQYGYPFLDFIETARITTAVTSVPNVLRGADHWIAYILDSQSQPVWQAGWVQAQGLIAIVAGSVVAGAGAAGLIALSRDNRRRHAARFATLSAVMGVALMTVGHSQFAGSPIADPVRAFLDGSGAAFRNVHKADPLVRLPFAIGVAVLLSRARFSARRSVRVGAVGVIIAAVLSPMALWAGRGGDVNSYSQIPAAWTSAAREIDALADEFGGSTLVLPAARTAEFGWGKTSDEPLSALTKSPIVVRAAAPLGHPGATRILDAVDDAVATGKTQPGLAEALQRMGIARVVVRHGVLDLVESRPAERAEQTLAASPGFTKRESFTGLTIWQVGSGESAAMHSYPANDLVVSGGPEAVLELSAAGLATDRAVQIEPGSKAAQVLTDSLRWRQFNSGRPSQLAYGPTLPADDLAPTKIGAKDLPPAGNVANQPVRQWLGLADVSASSSAADPFGNAWAGTAAGPAGALDADPETAWLTDAQTDGNLVLTLPEPTALGTLSVTAAISADELKKITVVARGKNGTSTRQVLKFTNAKGHVELGNDPVSKLELVLPKARTELVRGIAEVSSSLHRWGSRLVLPGEVDFANGQLLLSPLPEDPSSPSWLFTSAAQGSARVELFARSRPGTELDDLLDSPVQFRSNDRVRTEATGRPGAAFDRDDETTWEVPAGTRSAVVDVTFAEPTTFGTIEVPAGSLSSIRVSASGRTDVLPASGGKSKLRATKFRLELVGIDSSTKWQVPEIVWSEIPAKKDTVALECSTVSVGDSSVSFGGLVARSALLDSAPVSLEPCGSGFVSIKPGTTSVVAAAPGPMKVERLTIGEATLPSSAVRKLVAGQLVGGRLHVSMAAGDDAIIAMTQSANNGWRAKTTAGVQLTPRVVDGWRQGFEVPASAAEEIEVYFAPTTAQRAGLLTGPIALGLSLLVLLLTRRHRLTWPAESPSTVTRRSATGIGASTFLGFICGGVVGLGLGAIAWLLPRKWLVPAALGTMTLVGLALALLGVVEQSSAGAILGQIGGLFTLSLMIRGLFDTEQP